MEVRVSEAKQQQPLAVVSVAFTTPSSIAATVLSDLLLKLA